MVSVLVAAWNEEERIEQHIEGFLRLRYLRKELVLCAGGTDGTYARAQRYASAQVRVYPQIAGEGKQRALERGFAHARGSVIYLTDADCVLDDGCFEGMVYPLACGREVACSGSSQPGAAQRAAPFVALQAAVQRYSTLHAPEYANGLLGRNCTVQRALLETSGGLSAPAPTGTDYVLAQELVRSGARIRQLPEHRVDTHYPTRGRAYIRQQRRWLRNVLVHGHRYGDRASVRHGLFTSLTGLASLLLPLGTIGLSAVRLGASVRLGVGGTVPAVLWWLTLLVQRVRYVEVATRAAQTGAEGGIDWLRMPTLAALCKLVLCDCIAWSLVLVDIWLPARRDRW